MSDKYCHVHHRHHHYGNDGGGGCLIMLALGLIALPVIGIYKMITSKDEGIRVLGIIFAIILVIFMLFSKS